MARSTSGKSEDHRPWVLGTRKRQSFFRRLSWITHPITIFVSLQIVWLAMTLMWVIWFVGQQEAISDLSQKFGHEYFDTRVSLAILVVGCILLGVLCVGLISLFVVGQRQSYAVRQQRTFVSSVTHELKSPLASLQLSFETMTAREMSEPTRQRLMTMIQSDLDRLRRLVDQILVTGRLDRGLTLDEESRLTALADIVDKICENLSYLDSQLASRISLDCPSGLEISLPRGTLSLVLNNLIENAVKYSPKGTPIVVKVERVGKKIILSVRDQGLGLTNKEKRRMFGMFQRGETAIRKAIPGTGLGLYIVKTAAKSLGGRVWAESPGPGQGSTFFVSLPIQVSHV